MSAYAIQPESSAMKYNECPNCGTRWTPPELGCPKCQDAASPAATPRTDMFVDDHLHAWPRWDWQDHASAFANWARDLERELTSAQAALAAKDAEIAELKADNESLRTLWTEIRTVLIQSRAANCVCSYGALQADAVEAANAVLNRMPPDITAERAQLRAEVEALKAENRGMLQAGGYDYLCQQRDEAERRAAQYLATGEAIQKQLFAAQEDKERLDWLASIGYVAAHTDRHFEGRTARFGWSKERWDGAGLRAAIDAAREGRT